MIEIREERPEDIAEIRKINEVAFTAAFGKAPEVGLVDNLRRNCPDHISMVGTTNGVIVGHILFSPAWIEGVGTVEGIKTVEGMGLGPIAVLPEHQRKGVGSLLVRAGIERLKRQGSPFIILVGHPKYYPRFGFELASKRGIRCQWDEVPDDAFMILILDETAMAGVKGMVRFRKEFEEAM